jgi:hypothetical protein
MSGAIPLLPGYAFMVWTGATSRVQYTKYIWAPKRAVCCSYSLFTGATHAWYIWGKDFSKIIPSAVFEYFYAERTDFIDLIFLHIVETYQPVNIQKFH